MTRVHQFALVLFLAVAPPVHSQLIVEYPLPTAGSSPEGITTGPDGAIWFTEVHGGRVGRVTPDGEITEFPLPPSTHAREIVVGPDSNLWYADSDKGAIARMTTSGVVTEFLLGRGSPLNITAGLDGNLWFTGWVQSHLGTSYIGRITTAGHIDEFQVQAEFPGGVAFGPDGNVWFTDFFGNKVCKMSTTGEVVCFDLPQPDSRPFAITSGPDGNLWFTQLAGNRIGRITPNGSIAEFDNVVVDSGGLFDIAPGPDGNVWFVDWSGYVGFVTMSGQVRVFPVPTRNGGPIGITSGADGKVWFTENAGNRIGWIDPQLATHSVPALSDLATFALIAGIIAAATIAQRQ